MSESQHKRIVNEQLFKAANQHTKQLVERVLTIESQTFMPVRFVCECSDSECSRPIELSVEEFKLVHQYRNRFIVIPGHEAPDIEEVMDRHDHYWIVEKPAIPAS